MAMSNAKGPGKVAPPRGRLKHQGAAAMAEDLVRDAALSRASDDRLNHEPIVGVVADMTLAAEPPVNIALFGSWGSGKSSFFAALGDVLRQRDPSVRVARYDAWKYGGRALKQNFIQSVAGASPRLVDTLILDRGSRGSEFDPHGYE
ncbi:P-loop NTPase fold protein, partial [Promicromonospora xylanilytica]